MPVTRPTGELLRFQHRPLLDMDLDEGGNRLRLQVALAAKERRRVAAGFGQMFPERAAVIRPAHVEGRGVEPAEGGMGADIGAVEPGGFLGPDGHDGDVAAWLKAIHAQARERRESGHNPGGAVEVAALRNRIHMRADDQPRQRAVSARQRHIEVEGRIGLDFEAEALGRAARQAMGKCFALAIGRANDAAPDTGAGGELVEQRPGEFDIGFCSHFCRGRHHAPVQALSAAANSRISSMVPMVTLRQSPRP